MDRTIIEARLATLKSEFSSGQRLLAEHEAQAAALREQLLRISGAMRVLAELLGQVAQEETAKLTNT
ncbi:MAG: hypothetical protein ACOZCP_03965 [Pseudomonadota bacterium]